jgi:hypothetical protein
VLSFVLGLIVGAVVALAFVLCMHGIVRTGDEVTRDQGGVVPGWRWRP